MRTRSLLMSSVASLLLIVPNALPAQGFSLSLVGGISKDSRSETENFWKTGFNAGAHAFVSLPVLTVGVRVAYNSWSPDGAGQLEELTQNSTAVYTIQSVEGSQSVIEIVPSVRFALLNPPAGLRLDLQVGAGMYLVSSSIVTISGTYVAPGTTGSGTITLTSGSLTGFGPQIALPLTLAGMIEIVPVYSAYTAEGDWYNHWALNAGVRFGL